MLVAPLLLLLLLLLVLLALLLLMPRPVLQSCRMRASGSRRCCRQAPTGPWWLAAAVRVRSQGHLLHNEVSQRSKFVFYTNRIAQAQCTAPLPHLARCVAAGEWAAAAAGSSRRPCPRAALVVDALCLADQLAAFGPLG